MEAFHRPVTTAPTQATAPRPGSGPRRLAIAAAIFVGAVGTALTILRMTGLIHPFSVPTKAMAPAVSGGDHVMMEGISYLLRKPRRGDVVVFKTDGIESLPQGQMYIKRIAGEPGDRLQISDGKLFVNDARVSLSNEQGEITYEFPPFSERFMTFTNVTVPAGELYVLGDNSTDSSDSRTWGPVPAKNVMGRIVFCYWPLNRAGRVK